MVFLENTANQGVKSDKKGKKGDKEMIFFSFTPKGGRKSQNFAKVGGIPPTPPTLTSTYIYIYNFILII